MRLTNIFVFLFLLAAFSIGTSLTDVDRVLVDGSLDNATLIIQNITLNYNSSEGESIPNINGFMFVLEKYIKFIGSLLIEVMRAGIHFGQDNPGYFNPDFIFKIIKLILILTIISLLIKPIGYLVVLIILAGIYIKDQYVKNKKQELKPKRRKTSHRRITR